MKLYLTSTGLENEKVAAGFKDIFIGRDISQLSFLVVSVQDGGLDAFYLEKTLTEFRAVGAVNLEVFELKDQPFSALKKYDVIVVCGGNTFVYLDRIRKTGLDKFIIDSVKNNDSVYVGVSAGSIIAGPDIAIAGWGSEGDSNDINLQDLSGLGLTNIIVSPHYRDALKVEIDELKKVYDYKIYELTDEQALFLSYSDMGVLKNVSSMKFINQD